ncbi:hypothetical protein BDZ45DRAFT_797489 [Acephala macrosclerotiorum]|nr:hypothetical protein BDZ45DRAFT_797489 [Acephala macrosclerotiorum]
MNERARHEKWPKKFLHKRPGPQNRRHHPCRPKHSGEEQRWNQHRYPYPPNERMLLSASLSYDSEMYPKSSHMADGPHESARRSTSSAEYYSADSWPSFSSFEGPARGKMQTGHTSSWSSRRTPPCFQSSFGNQSILDVSHCYPDDDGFYVEEYRCTRLIPTATLQGQRGSLQTADSYSSNLSSCVCSQCKRSGARERIEPHKTLNYIDNDLDLIEDELPVTHLLIRSSMQTHCRDDLGCPSYHPPSTHIPGGLLEDENSYLSRAPDFFPGRFSATGDDFTMSGGLMGGIVTGVGMVTGMLPEGSICASEIALDDTFEDELEESELEQAEELALLELIAAKQREAELSDIMRHMALQRDQYAHSYPASRVKQEQSASSFQQPTVKPGEYTLRKRRTIEYPQNAEAKAKLDRYNKWWTDAQSRGRSTRPSLDLIPFLSPSNPPNSPSSDSGYDWKWAAHEFFCLAFNLQPKAIFQLDTSPRLTLKPHHSSSPNSTIQNLHALRAQLKLEKVRWHEDKLRSLFGDEIARDERAKSVWSAVIGLKGEVEQVLERGH